MVVVVVPFVWDVGGNFADAALGGGGGNFFADVDECWWGWSHNLNLNLNHNHKVKSPTVTWTAESAKPKAHVCTQTFVCPGSGTAQDQRRSKSPERFLSLGRRKSPAV